MQKNKCLVCGSQLLSKLYDPGPLPLSCSDIYLEDTPEEAHNAPRYPMEFVRCQICSHTFNIKFNPDDIHYEDGATIMYTETSIWEEHIDKTVTALGAHLVLGPATTVLEIGANDGSYLDALQDRYNCSAVGFDPGTNNPDSFIKDYFDPQRDLMEYFPNLIVCRHTLEHMEDPRGFISNLAYWCMVYGQSPYVFSEVPNFEKAYIQGRIQDLTYAHVSQFTETSLVKLFELSGYSTWSHELTFEDEIIVGLFQPSLSEKSVERYNDTVQSSIESLKGLDDLVLWGGSGKCASFLNIYDTNIKHVVDSDPSKIGLYVPGTGQEITSPNTIKPHETIVIPNVWRAHEIYQEIKHRDLEYKNILLPIDGELREYTR